MCPVIPTKKDMAGVVLKSGWKNRTVAAGGLCAIVVFSRGAMNLLGRVAVVFAHQRLGVRALSISPSTVRNVRGFAVAAFTSRSVVSGIIGRVSGQISVLGTCCGASRSLIFRRVTLCGLDARLFVGVKAIRSLVHGCGTHVLRVGRAYIILRGDNRCSRARTLFERLDRAVNILRFVHSNHITVAGDHIRHLDSVLTRVRHGLRRGGWHANNLQATPARGGRKWEWGRGEKVSFHRKAMPIKFS